MSSSHITLPAELWTLIVRNLAHEEKRTCLFVSRQLHDIAVFVLFSRVTLYFGLWRPGEDWWSRDRSWDDDEVPDVEARANITWDLLRHISRTPSFATVVKTVSVHAYALGDGLFETRCLAEALEALHNLRSFHWYGGYPPPKPIVLGTLARSVGGSALSDLRLPLCDEVVASLSGFTKLCTLILIQEEPLELSDTQAKYPLIHAAIGANSHTLNRLSIHGDALWGCQIRSYFHLHELELILPTDLGGLSLIFHHCTRLRSFSLYTSGNRYQLSALLESNPTALPDLTSFKLITQRLEISEADHAALSKFLENKKKLRRLDVSHDTYDDSVHFLLPFLPVLPALEVLGLDLPALPFDAGWDWINMRDLDEKIPLKISALMVRVPPEWETEERFTDQEWIKLFKKRTSLGYLHILDGTDDMDLKQQLLEDHPASLQLVGYGPYLRWLRRDDPNSPDGDGKPSYSSCWSLEKVAHRTVEDFGCEDWEWLLRHHDRNGLDSLAPGLY